MAPGEAFAALQAEAGRLSPAHAALFAAPVVEETGIGWGAPGARMLPYADLFWTGVLTIVINLIMSSAFAAILIYAMELLPGRIGLVGGFFYGLSFGLGGVAAAILGEFADRIGIDGVYRICSFLPAIGLLAWFLPNLKTAPAR